MQLLVLEHVDCQKNMARYYVLSIEPTLFDGVALVREWGRFGTKGRRRVDLHPDRIRVSVALETWLQRKVRRGYREAC